eukprot:CAMPEP_0198142606 /NCGR_PEP_ID=MMETSP1443-20131203/5357_1 /TAXON_ID=186043 /ORGANISM="Entomoneis sp., Strain CCMP2396" /LENGTH=366 /DNA_ID=CAMNT_0043805659 /DNA_START=1 /DNA_END=1101 /DNA_ORIENTATION=-
MSILPGGSNMRRKVNKVNKEVDAEEVDAKVIDAKEVDVKEVDAKEADVDHEDVTEEAVEGSSKAEDDEPVDKEVNADVSLSKEEEFVSDGKYRNKQRCLVVCSRGVTARYRHLLEDLRTLMPHHKKESKLDSGKESTGRALNDIASLRSCTSVLFLECRKHQDCYMWLSRMNGDSPGPSVRFQVTNVHTMDELRLTGNCLRGSRPMLSFDQSFDQVDHLRLLKGLFVDTFGTPRGHPKAKPFVDRVMSFVYADNRIWVRNYQILESQPENAKEAHEAKKDEGRASTSSLVEIGPRFVLNTIRIFKGSFGGPTLYQNPEFVSPNTIRSLEKRSKGSVYIDRKRSREKAKERKEMIVVPVDPLASVFS